MPPGCGVLPPKRAAAAHLLQEQLRRDLHAGDRAQALKVGHGGVQGTQHGRKQTVHALAAGVSITITIIIIVIITILIINILPLIVIVTFKVTRVIRRTANSWGTCCGGG